MKLLIFGDIFGRIGRNAFLKELPSLKEKYAPDFVIANVDNITSGRGATEKHILELYKAGVDAMTLGDHIFDNFDNIKDCIFNKNSNLLAFANFYDEELASSGAKVFEKNGKKLLVIHLQGEMFMNYKVVNPFLKAKEILKKYEKEKLDGIIVDFHREVTSEVYGLANYLDGEVGFVFGTHTHIQTNDERILKNGTGMICDVGMSGPLDSIIGVSFDSVKKRFLTGIAKGKLEQALGKDYVVSGVFVELGKKGKCEKVEKIRIVKS